jgi:hypothetical protein
VRCGVFAASVSTTSKNEEAAIWAAEMEAALQVWARSEPAEIYMDAVPGGNLFHWSYGWASQQ